jgi:hypothetical protein
MRKTPLPHEGPKKMTRGWNPFLIRIPCHLLLKCHFLEEIWARLPNNRSEPLHFIWISLLGTPHKWTNSYEFLYFGHPKGEPLHMNFFCTWDTSQVNKFIWISWPGTRQKWTTSMWVWSHVYWKIKNLKGGNTRLRGRIARAPFRRSFVSRVAIL